MSGEGPTIARRLQPGFIVVSTDDDLVARLREAAGEDWQVLAVATIEDAGDWGDILLYRFILMDLDHGPADPADEVRHIRQELMVNTPVFGLGGDDDLQGRTRKEGGDRFFGRDQALDHLPDLLEAFGW
jgi:hypothetical protein